MAYPAHESSTLPPPPPDQCGGDDWGKMSGKAEPSPLPHPVPAHRPYQPAILRTLARLRDHSHMGSTRTRRREAMTPSLLIRLPTPTHTCTHTPSLPTQHPHLQPLSSVAGPERDVSTAAARRIQTRPRRAHCRRGVF